jgi:hypothetical protein
MPPPPHSHRSSFKSMTVLASCLAVVLFLLAGLTPYLSRWASAHHLLPAGNSWVTILLATSAAVGLVVLGLFVALVAVGGCVALYRDSCEELGLPYFPNRPRERITGPILLAIRRFLHPGARLSPGEWVEVRSLPEILATLDAQGRLEGLPFMPEMTAYCGQRYPVHRRVDKIWEYVHRTGMRRVRRAVLLKTLRCNGQSHGGCQAACQLIWKEAWLKPAGARDVHAPGTSPAHDPGARTPAAAQDAQRYFCQMTEIRAASTQLGPRNVAHYWRDLSGGNFRLVPLLVELSIRLFNSTQWRMGRPRWPVFQPAGVDTTPHQDLGLQPGQIVRVKSKHAIEQTLNRNFSNRGLGIGPDQLYYCGGSYRVVARINRIVHEGTGEMLLLKTPSILLEEVTEIGGAVLNPQNQYYFWREIWLEPQSPAAIRQDG